MQRELERDRGQRARQMLRRWIMDHIRKILVPMDGSRCSDAALSQAVALAEDLGADVEVLHITAPDEFEVGSTTETADSVRQQSDREMDASVAAAERRLGGRLKRRSESGDPLRKILEVAAEGVDLVVMGTHGRVGRLHSLLGSVAEGVVRNSRCPVLTVREPGGEGESFAERLHGRSTLADQGRPSR
jgi:nucleotide-binding universal stress UspA family protein